MDTSKTYIKMCEKAVEIQESWMPSLGNMLWHRELGLLLCVEVFENEHYGTLVLKQPDAIHRWDKQIEGRVNIWLPRQDQLQEMFPKQDSFYQDVIFFRDMIKGFGDKFLSHQADTWEQLWLILVMRYKYKKVWNGEDWEEFGNS